MTHLNTMIYLVNCVLNTDAARARAWFLMAAVSMRREGVVEHDLYFAASVDGDVLEFRTHSMPLARRLTREADAIRAEAGVTEQDASISEPTEECDHDPDQKPDITGTYHCDRCGQSLGKL